MQKFCFRTQIGCIIEDKIHALMTPFNFYKVTYKNSIPKEKLEAINSEFQAFAQSKLSLIKLAKDFHQKFTKQIDELKIPSLEDYLSTKYATTANKVVCEYCQRGFKNKASLASHLKGCAEKKAINNPAPVITIN